MRQITTVSWLTAIGQLKAQSAPEASASLSWDSSFLAGLFQAAATVVAVIIGYLLSVFAEQKAWKRRRSEQLRERRLQSFIDFIDQMSQIMDWMDASVVQARELSSRAGGSSTPAAKDALMAGVRSRIQAMQEEARIFSGDIRRRLTELKVLRVGDTSRLLAEKCSEVVEKLRDLLGLSAFESSDLARVGDEIVDLRKQIDINLAALTSQAADSIDD